MPYDPLKPLAGTAPEGYLRAQVGETQYLAQSGTSLLKELRGLGLEVRTQDFFDIRRDVLGITKYSEQIMNLRPETRVPASWINDTHGWDIKADFVYRIQVTGLDPNTGAEIARFFSLRSNPE